MKRWLSLALLVLLALPAGGQQEAPDQRWVAAGLAAKVAGTSILVAGHSMEWVRANDLAIEAPWERLAFPHTTLEVDRGAGTVTARLGGVERVAVLREGYGCTLVDGVSAAELRARTAQLPPRAARDTADLPWPAGERLSDEPLPEGVDLGALGEVLDEAFREHPGRPARRTHGVVVVYRGRLVIERYAEEFGPRTPVLGASLTKSLLDALVGIRVGQGAFALDTPTGFGPWSAPGDSRAALTPTDLLRMESGLFCDEEGLAPDGLLAQMLFGVPSASRWAGTNKEHVHAPRTTWRYCSGSSNIVAQLLRETFDDPAEALTFPARELFDCIGMASAFIETDPSGSPVASSLGYASARDWARFGLLYLHDGVWQGERILPEGWVATSTTPSGVPGKGHYGRHWWLNAGDPSDPARRFFPGLPTDLFFALGYGSQIVAVFPSHDLVVVRVGMTKSEDAWDHGSFLRGILAGLGLD